MRKPFSSLTNASPLRNRKSPLTLVSPLEGCAPVFPPSGPGAAQPRDLAIASWAAARLSVDAFKADAGHAEALQALQEAVKASCGEMESQDGAQQVKSNLGAELGFHRN